MMDKEDVIYVHITCGVHTHTHTHTHTLEYYSAVKNEILPPKVGGLRGYYAKWNKSDRKINTVWFHLCGI